MFKDRCPGSLEIRQPKPEYIRCQMCGEVLEIWTDEPDIGCKKCHYITSRPLGSSCVEWCVFAKECVGPERYERLKKAMKDPHP